MAEVTKQRLSIEKTSEKFDQASVKFELNFTEREVRENIRFGVFMMLMERDEEFERYHKAGNGVFSFCFSPFNLPNSGNHICWMANKTVQPNGNSIIDIEFINEVISQKEFCDQANYRVYIFVMPEVLCGQAWTDAVCVNYK